MADSLTNTMVETLLPIEATTPDDLLESLPDGIGECKFDKRYVNVHNPTFKNLRRVWMHRMFREPEVDGTGGDDQGQDRPYHVEEYELGLEEDGRGSCLWIPPMTTGYHPDQVEEDDPYTRRLRMHVDRLRYRVPVNTTLPSGNELTLHELGEALSNPTDACAIAWASSAVPARSQAGLRGPLLFL